MSALREQGVVLLLRAIQAADRLRLRALRWLHPGLEIDPSASSNLAHAHYALGPGARLLIGPGVVTERNPGLLWFSLGANARVEIGAGAWLRTELGPVHIVAFEDATLTLGPEAFLNGCHLSAKQSLTVGRRAWVGPGSRVFDSEHPEVSAPVVIGDYVWVASDVTVLRGVTIGEHSVIGARSLVTSDIPPHSLAFGSPARVRGSVGDRSRVR